MISRGASEGALAARSPAGPGGSLRAIGGAWSSAGRASRAYFVVGMLVAFVYFFAPQGLGHHVLYDGLGLSSVAAILYGVRLNRPASRTPWYLFAAGQMGFVVGDGIRAFYEIGLAVEAPFPGLADAAYIAGYPLLMVGLMMLVRSRDKAKDRGNLIDALIVVTSVGVVSWIYLMEPYTSDPHVNWLEMVISIAYPLMDLLLLGVAARLMVSPGVRPAAYYLLCGSLIGLLAADSGYTVTLLNETYHTGILVDAGWLVSYVMFGAAALHPSIRDIASALPDRELKISRQRIALLAGASLLAPGVRVAELLRGHELPPLTTVIPTIVLFLLVIARLSGLVEMLSAALARHNEAERRRRQSEARFGSLIQHASDVVTVIDKGGDVTFQSPSVKKVLGYDSEELIGQPLSEVIHEDDWVSVHAILDEMTSVSSHEPATVLCRWRHKDGSWREVEATVTNLLEDPTVAGMVLNGRDVTEQAELQAQLAHQAFHDPLTDLANRTLFRDRVEHTLDRRTAKDRPVAVLFVDIDDFKTVNDSLGHSAGDELLVELSKRIRGCLRAGDTPARLGGDEFAILLEDSTDAEAVATRIGEALVAPFVLQVKEVFVTASIGVSVSEVGQGGADELLRNADAAMYSAKSRGKARSVVFQPDMHVRALQRLDLEAELRRAIERKEFRLHYQPLVDVETKRITGLEALLRWAHPERGLIGPAEFISLAEDTGLIRPIGRWVLEQAAHQAREWQVRYPDQQLTMSVNLSAPELAARGLDTELRRVLAQSGLDPSTLVLEITERVLMSDTEATMERLRQLRDLGVRLSVDDFGTGFSSLSYLHTFPIDALKIAKPFIDGIPEGGQETALVRGIVELGHNLDLEIVAEGIERSEQWDALSEVGCDLGQGYLLARPQGAERIDVLLGNVAPVAASGTPTECRVLTSDGLLGNIGRL